MTPAPASLLDLSVLERDPAPSFVTLTVVRPSPFELIYANEAFRKRDFQDTVIAQNEKADAFRSWAQSLSSSASTTYNFAGLIWAMSITDARSNLRSVQAIRCDIEQTPTQDAQSSPRMIVNVPSRRGLYKHPISDLSDSCLVQDMEQRVTVLRNAIPQTDLYTQWEGIHIMMEMSDIGIFECNPDGKILYANEAWYRLSSYPRNVPVEGECSFKELVLAEDRELFESRWKTLTQGHSITAEMRWKPHGVMNSDLQWILLTCVPAFDNQARLVRVAGSTIDISAQKRFQEESLARKEALEQAKLLEIRFMKFAELSPTAIYIYIPGSGMQFVNDQFCNLTGNSKAPGNLSEWFDLIAEEDVERVKEYWTSMLVRRETLENVQFRLRKTWRDQDGCLSNIWVQCSSYPQTDDHGHVMSIMGTLFDISHFKWAESVQRKTTQEALESKRQQENFIDMTSHELRNPLSAIVQCADSVIASLRTLHSQASDTSISNLESSQIEEHIETSIDALQTIISCSQHQRRVIDDVLTLSKLDSDLILITPIPVRPVVIISDAMKMFEVECRQVGIKLELVEDRTIEDLKWVMLDPSRLLQVLINLLTNAIKFTKDREERNITVKLGASWRRPLEEWRNVDFTSDESLQPNLLDKPEWGTGKIAYLWVKVTDTGCGMSCEEQKKLFARFSQATPRTHVKYGGSGLGLFISKSLATLQGGAIGVSSEGNVGTTFALYVSVRLAQCPDGQEAKQTKPVTELSEATALMKAKPLSILIVEDNLVNQKILKKQLQQVGWTVFVAGNGKEALDWLKASSHWQGGHETSTDRGAELSDDQKPSATTRAELDMILMDIEMPVMDGLACTRQIRKWEQQGLLAPPCRPCVSKRRNTGTSSAEASPNSESDGKLSRLPVLAVSANARPEQIEQAVDAGMDDAISKPFRIHELWSKIQGTIPRLS